MTKAALDDLPKNTTLGRRFDSRQELRHTPATRMELAWAAGLFEGEGCFYLRLLKRGRLPYPHATLSMSDKDSVERFAEAIGFGRVYLVRKKQEYKDLYRWEVNGFEATQQLVCLLWYGLGERRKARAAEILRLCHSGDTLHTP